MEQSELALGAISAVSQASPLGFLQVLVFVLIALIAFWVWIMHKDRQRVGRERDQKWEDHLRLHAQEQKAITDRLDEMNRILDSKTDMLIKMIEIKRTIDR